MGPAAESAQMACKRHPCMLRSAGRCSVKSSLRCHPPSRRVPPALPHQGASLALQAQNSSGWIGKRGQKRCSRATSARAHSCASAQSKLYTCNRSPCTQQLERAGWPWQSHGGIKLHKPGMVHTARTAGPRERRLHPRLKPLQLVVLDQLHGNGKENTGTEVGEGEV